MEQSGPSRERITVAGRDVIVVRGTRTQTVNICTPANTAGQYQARFRLPITADLRTADLANLTDLDALTARLQELGAEPEDPVTTGTRPLPPLVPAPPGDDPWLRRATDAVDHAIDTLLTGFLDAPYLHRVEHSLHAEVFGLLKTHDALAEHAHLRTGQQTQLVHKEWPETLPRDNDGTPRPRGLFDLAVLSPAQLHQATLEQFRTGRIAPAIAIEIGLDYGVNHLRGDGHKLANSAVTVPYLIHLSRLPVRDTTAIEDAATLPPPARVAYVHHDATSGHARIKRITDSAIHDHQAQPEPATAPGSMTLHDAMRHILRTAPGRRLPPRTLCEEINRQGLYRMQDGRPVQIQQIHARSGNYPHLFRRTGGDIELIG